MKESTYEIYIDNAKEILRYIWKNKSNTCIGEDLFGEVLGGPIHRLINQYYRGETSKYKCKKGILNHIMFCYSEYKVSPRNI